MKSAMEKIAEEIALSVLRNLGISQSLTVPPGTLERDFCDRWPSDGSRYPINDAIDAVASLGVLSAVEQSAAWRAAVDENITNFFEAAQERFDAGDYLQGTEALADAVGASLGYIASTFGWPHADDDDLYRAAAALATGGPFPSDDENLYVLLDDASDEGLDLCGALGAVMGRPEAVKCGLYGEEQTGVREDAQRFATMTIAKAKSLAGEKAVAS